MPRAFIAIALPTHLQQGIWEETTPLRNSIQKGIIRWVPPENIHLTLKFLGETSKENICKLKKILGTEIAKIPPFEISLSKIGAFPNLSRPNVIWLGVENSRQLFSLQNSVEMVSSQIGSVPEKRRFSAHLTLGRVKRKKLNKISRSQIRTMIEENPTDNFAKVRVEFIHLFESQLKPSGAEYRSLYKAKLGEFF